MAFFKKSGIILAFFGFIGEFLVALNASFTSIIEKDLAAGSRERKRKSFLASQMQNLHAFKTYTKNTRQNTEFVTIKAEKNMVEKQNRGHRGVTKQ